MNHALKRVSIQEDVTYLVISDLISIHTFLKGILEAQSLRKQTNPPQLQIDFLFSVEVFSKPFISVNVYRARSFMKFPELSRAILSTIWLCEQRVFSM